MRSALRSRVAGRVGRGARTTERLDGWLEHVGGERLAAIEAACAEGGDERYALFRGLETDLWALLLTREYDAFPNIRALLPDVPDPQLQELWNGTSGVALAAQGAAFYRRLRGRFAEHAGRGLAGARVLDFGCGWGRLTRFLARDVAPGDLYCCDPVQEIVDVCAQCRVPAVLARSDPRAEALPFAGPFDLAFAFSVFTHLSEAAHERALRALHAGLAPGAILVVTIRPPAYLRLSPHLAPAERALGTDPEAALRAARHVFVAHEGRDSHPQFQGGEMDYGEAIITLPYVRERWAPRFEILDVDLLAVDLYQLMVTLRRI
jgi:SAM-dependent methyltransferase